MSNQPHMDLLSRFSLAHAQCPGGEVEFADPMPEDFDLDGRAMWVTARCPGCGATTRERVPNSEMFADLPGLLHSVGSSMEEYRAAIERKDTQMSERIAERVMKSPAMAHLALRSIRRAQEGETRN